MNENECFSNGTENAAKSIIDALKLKDNSKKDQDNDNCTSERESNMHVWPVEKGDEPLCEWTNNDVLIGGCFPFLFLRGSSMLPKSTFSASLMKHLYLYYDGRFESTQTFTHLLFNQYMRHIAIRKIAKAESSNKKYLENLGSLLKREDFKEALHYASSNPSEKSSIALNNKLMRILSFVGKDLPFSAFERSQSKAKFSGMSMTHGYQSSFITIAPPEQDDLLLLKLQQIRKTKNYNGKIEDSMFVEKDYTWDKLPPDIRDNPRRRLLISQKMPAQSVLVYLRVVDTLLTHLLKCPESKDTRVSRTRFDRKNSILGKVGGFIGVTEPQNDGRLHLHLLQYSSTMSPNLLTQIIPSEVLRRKANNWLDRTCCTCLSNETHEWIESLKKENKSIPRSSEIPLVLVEISEEQKETWSAQELHDAMSKILKSFKLLLERKNSNTGFHNHSHTCEKGAKGKFLCRLLMARGVWNEDTCPLMIVLDQSLNLADKRKPTFVIGRLSKEMIDHVDTKVKYSEGFISKGNSCGPILWEQKRGDKDKYFVETNIYLAMLDSHTNLSIMTSIDQAIPVEDYLTEYTTKMSSAEMSCIASTMLAAMNYCNENKSKADDYDTDMRKSKFFAARTINAFQGKMQHEVKTMIAALMGLKSDLSSEKFFYLFSS